jgi:peroxiredoxin
VPIAYDVCIIGFLLTETPAVDGQACARRLSVQSGCDRSSTNVFIGWLRPAGTMVTDGDSAPDFTAPLANGDLGEMFTLSERLDEAPLVLAFFPGAFSSVCTGEMKTFQERLGDFEAAGANIYGISVDSPFALNAFREDNGLEYDLISDPNHEVVESYDATMEFADLGIDEVAQRAVFVVNGDGEITYAWSSADPGVEPDYDAVESAARNAA